MSAIARSITGEAVDSTHAITHKDAHAETDAHARTHAQRSTRTRKEPSACMIGKTDRGTHARRKPDTHTH